MSELGSTYAKLMIETLLHVHALTNMHRASNKDEHRRTAAEWIPALESNLASLRRALAAESALPERTRALEDGLGAAIRAAKLALFVIRKQGVMPNSNWQAGFDSDLAKAEAARALSAPNQGGQDDETM